MIQFMSGLLRFLNLSDRYDLKARIVPSIVVTFPLMLGACSVTGIAALPKTQIGVAALVGAALVIALSHLTRAAGGRLETRLVKKWGGLPTTRWLRSGDASHSPEQGAIWCAALSKVSGIDIETSTQTRSSEEFDKVIADAVLTSRSKLRASTSASAKFLRITNEDYGLARNLAGLRWEWLISAVFGFVLSVFAVTTGRSGFGCSIFSFTILAIVVFALARLDEHVRHCSERYAEAFFAAVLALSKTKTAK